LAVNVALPAFAAERRRLLLIDISCRRGAQQQTHCMLLLLLLSIDISCRRGAQQQTRRMLLLLSIDISCRRGAQQQTRRMLLLLSIDGIDRQTDRLTDARPFRRFINPARHTMRSSVNK